MYCRYFHTLHYLLWVGCANLDNLGAFWASVIRGKFGKVFCAPYVPSPRCLDHVF